MIQIERSIPFRIKQGDIFRDVEYIEYADLKDGIVDISKVIFPLVVVLTQDCDLEQDYNFRKKPKDTQDKYLLSVLVAPVYNAEHVFLGDHLTELGIKMMRINSDKKSQLKLNEIPRFHFLDFPEESNVVPSVVDFKQYFSVHIDYLQKVLKEQYVCSISSLFREQLSHRFAFYLSRIGLPDLVKQEQENL